MYLINCLIYFIAKTNLSLKRKKQEDSGKYIIGQILDRRISSNGDRQYLIKWKDYPNNFNSWEPYNNLKEAWDMIEEFEKKRRLKLKRKEIRMESKGNNKKAKKANERNHLLNNQRTSQRETKEEKIDKLHNNFLALMDQNSSNTKVSNSNLNINENISKQSNLPLYVDKLEIQLDGKLSALVKYNNSEKKLVDYEDFKLLFPQKMLEFFESRIVFPFDNSGTKKFIESHKRKHSDC